MFNEDFFKKLNKINMYINFKLTGGTQGGRKSKAKGVSVEFSDYREYAPGDDFRRIDWNAYGRFDKFFIKVFMEEREGVFNFFIDKSKSMDYGKDNKKDTALKIVAALSYIAFVFHFLVSFYIFLFALLLLLYFVLPFSYLHYII